MYIVIRNNKKFIIDNTIEKIDYIDGKYKQCVFITGNCKELSLFNRTIVLTKKQFVRRLIN